MLHRKIGRRLGALKLKYFIPAAAILLVFFLGINAPKLHGRTKAMDASQAIFSTRRGPLTISLTESGIIKSADQLVLKSQLEGKNSILYLIPEGTRARKGDLLVELDATALKDQRVEQQIQVFNAEASYVRARENAAVAKNQADSDVELAQLKLDFAKHDLDRFNKGEFPNQLREAEAKITLAQEEFNRANEKARWSKVLFDEKYLSQSDLQSDELAAKKCELNLELSKGDLLLLQDFTHKRTLAQLESDVSQATMELQRITSKATADKVQADSDLKARLSEYDQQKEKLKRIEDQIAKAKIIAPADGLVVYSTSVYRDPDDPPLAEGQLVRERQDLIYLPTSNVYVAGVKIHESSLEKVEIGMPARLRVDALPGRTLTGRITKIAPLPDQQSIMLNPDLKVYNAEVAIDGENDFLRTGMSCKAEILIDQYMDALYVPVQSVQRKGRFASVFVGTAAQPELRMIETGVDNNIMAPVIKGLKEGEAVLLNPPQASGQKDQAIALAPRDEDSAAVASENQKLIAAATMESFKRLGQLKPEQKDTLRKKYEAMSADEKWVLLERLTTPEPKPKKAKSANKAASQPNAEE